MKIIPLPFETIVETGFNYKVILDYTDISGTAATTCVVPILPEDGATKTFPAGTAILRCATNLVTAFDFSDAGITSCTLEIGFTGGDVDQILVSQELAVDGTEILFKVSNATTQPLAVTAADTLDALFTVANGGSPLCSEATSGKVEVYLFVVDLNRLEDVL